MNISIKKFDVNMEIKNNGIELDIYSSDGEHVGDLIITKAKLIWCKGRTGRKGGVSVPWNEFIEYMEGE